MLRPLFFRFRLRDAGAIQIEVEAIRTIIRMRAVEKWGKPLPPGGGRARFHFVGIMMWA